MIVTNIKVDGYHVCRLKNLKKEQFKKFRDYQADVEIHLLDDLGLPVEDASAIVRRWNVRYNRYGYYYRLPERSYKECGANDL